MNLYHAVVEGVRDLWSHKFRSFLTVLGIILGVASLLTMFAITKGISTSYREQLQQSGDLEKIRVRADAPPQNQAAIAEISPGLTYQDAEALRKAGSLLEWVSPMVEYRGRIHYGNKSDGTRILGVETDFLKMDRHRMLGGRFITALDVEQKARVVVLGDHVVDRLFGQQREAVVGSWVKINDVQFRVVGVFPRYLTRNQEREKARGIAERQAARKKERGSRGRAWGSFQLEA
ncbi:MAG: ABC transporter permease [Blastochloris sp.]|nr:ABC transporter permease [Blastochloris sp.]